MIEKNNPLVSICVTTYNRKKLLKNTITSILVQTYKNFEIILLDDNSTDGTEEFVKKELLSLDSRIRYYKHEENKGLAFGRNTAIKNSKGKYFTFCDDDDTWNIDFLKIHVTFAEKYSENYIFASSIISGKNIIGFKSSLKNLLYLGYTPPVGSQFYNLAILKKINGYNTEVKSGVDHDLWIKLATQDIMIFWINKSMIKVNNISTDNRMTFNISKRLEGTKNSIEFWGKAYKYNYDSKFFESLKSNYKYNTYKKFLKLSILNRDIHNIFSYIKKLNIIYLVLDLKRFILSRLNKEMTLKNPTFFPIFHKKNKEILTNKIEIIYDN